MRNKYTDLIEQSFEWPQEDFFVRGEQLYWHRHPTHGADPHLRYAAEDLLPAQNRSADPKGTCSVPPGHGQGRLSGGLSLLLLHQELGLCLRAERSPEAQGPFGDLSAFDINIIEKLVDQRKLTNAHYIICNGFKTAAYLDNIARLRGNGFEHIIPVLDHAAEADELAKRTNKPLDIGIRIASEEEPKFAFYTSRLGIGYKDIVPFYEQRLKDDEQFRLKMLHFFINTGINDTAYYWSELLKCVHVYCALKKVCSDLDSLNIGGGFPVKNSLDPTSIMCTWPRKSSNRSNLFAAKRA